MKNITKIILSAITLIVLIYLLISIQVKQEVSSNITVPDFMMELKDIRLRGWNKEKVVWEMKATTAYYYDKNSLVMSGVNEGFFHDSNGNSLIKEINISTVNANIIRKEFTLIGVTLDINSDSEEAVILKAENLKYVEGLFTTEEGYSLKSGDWEITSGKLSYNTNINTMEFLDNINISKDKSSLKSERGSYSPEKNLISLSENVNITHFIINNEKEYKLDVSADKVEALLGKGEPNFNFPNGMVFRFGDDVLEAEHGRYEPQKKLMKMKDVMIRVDDGSQILNNVDNKDIKGSIIKAKEVSMDFKEKIVQLSGSVSYDRKQRRIKSNFGSYDVDKGLLYLTGAVSIVEGNKTIRSNNVMVDVKNDTIVAKGNVKTKLQI